MEMENQPEVSLAETFLDPSGHGRPHLQIMDVQTTILIFQDFEHLSEVFGPRRPLPVTPSRLRDLQPENFLSLLQTDFFTLLVTRQCAAPVTTSTGYNFLPGNTIGFPKMITLLN